MFFKRTNWASDQFPRELFHDSKSKRGGVLMHSKVCYFRLIRSSAPSLTYRLEMILGTLRRKSSYSGDRGRTTGEGDDDSVTESESDDGDSDIVERKVTGWVYVGSHNFTTAAWGSFQAKSTAFSPIFAVSPLQSRRKVTGSILIKL